MWSWGAPGTAVGEHVLHVSAILRFRVQPLMGTQACPKFEH